MASTLKVQSTREDNRVVVYEQDPAHPNGEALVFKDGDRVFEVGDTPLIRQRLHEQQLVEAKAASAPEKK